MESHTHKHPEAAPPQERPVDAGSQALAEALRSSFAIVKFVMVILLLVFFGSGFFIVGPQERAVVLRLGKPLGEGDKALLGPGLHWSLPYPIDEYRKVSISGIQKVVSSVGWYAVTPEQEMSGTEPPAGAGLPPGVDGYALTADGNIVHLRATVSYHIEDPIGFLFNFVNASNAVQSAVDNALLYTAARFQVDDILTKDRLGFQAAVRHRLNELVEKQNLGVVVEQCSVESVPPRQLKDAFANVLKAEFLRTKALTEARSYENQTLSKATADARSRVNLAEGDRARVVNETRSEAERFNELLPQYRENPQLFVQQRLTETLGRVLTNVQDKIFVTEGSASNPKEIRYLFNRELQKPKSEEERK
jgi:membrane protease subunit HflK